MYRFFYKKLDNVLTAFGKIEAMGPKVKETAEGDGKVGGGPFPPQQNLQIQDLQICRLICRYLGNNSEVAYTIPKYMSTCGGYNLSPRPKTDFHRWGHCLTNQPKETHTQKKPKKPISTPQAVPHAPAPRNIHTTGGTTSLSVPNKGSQHRGALAYANR